LEGRSKEGREGRSFGSQERDAAEERGSQTSVIFSESWDVSKIPWALGGERHTNVRSLKFQIHRLEDRIYNGKKNEKDVKAKDP
jgi:hypothetical protein